jgi:hypothetical protein
VPSSGALRSFQIDMGIGRNSLPPSRTSGLRAERRRSFTTWFPSTREVGGKSVHVLHSYMSNMEYDEILMTRPWSTPP